MNPRLRTSLIALLFVIGILIRLASLGVVSGDMRLFLLPWYDFITTHDLATALRGEFSNYTPPYIYLLTLAARTNFLLPKIVAIKLISIVFDFINAYIISRIVKVRAPQGDLPLLAAALFLCLPTPALNSAAWGQADAIYTCCLLACLLFFLRDRPAPALFMFGLAFAFKAQAIFLSPFLLLLTFKRRIPLWTFGLVPAAYALAMLPALLAGRSIPSALNVYLGQANFYRSLSMKAPNLYLLIPNEYYQPVLIGGLILAGIAALAWTVFYARKIVALTSETLVLCAAVSVTMMPFLLPKMHDRYFYLMDVFTFVLVFFIPRLWIPALASQVVSGLTYFVFLVFSPQNPPPSIGAVFLLVAVLINTTQIAYLAMQQYIYISKEVRHAHP